MVGPPGVTGTVLGTAIVQFPVDPRPAFLVSDLHVPDGGGPVVAAFQSVLQQARRLSARVFVLGDLFDSFVSPRQLRVGVWRDIASRCAIAAAAGVDIALLHGNRDFLLGDEFARASGAQVVAGGIRCTLAGRDALLLHGDELCQNDLPYQRAKRWLRSAAVRWLARRLPLRLALAAAARARRRSQQVIAGGDQSRFLPTAAAVTAALASGADLLVFGHIHRMAQGRFGGGEYRILPAFDQHGIGLLAAGDTIRYVRCHEGGVEPQSEPAALEFAPSR